MKSLEELDRLIGGLVKRWASRVSGVEQPPAALEIRREVLQEVARRVEPIGGGEYVFPYNEVRVSIFAPDEQRRGLYEAAFVEGDTLAAQIREVLADAGAPVAALIVTVQVLEGDAPPEVVCLRRARESRAAARPQARLTVLRGDSEDAQLEITAGRVNLGRLREVTTGTGSLRRRNHIAFADSEKTVSREHATIRYDAPAGKFRVYDSMSQRGTAVFREGRRIEVPRGDQRGVQLQTGDEIHLGNARVRFDLL
jgi:hypothetical protein